MKKSEAIRTAIRGLSILCPLLLIAVAFANFQGHRVYVDSDSPQIMMERYSWWGLRSEIFEIRWLQIPDPDFGEYGAWCRKAKDGTWHQYLYEYPLITNEDR
jgi:hypothetical protein